MKKHLFAIGIIAIIACALSFAYAALNLIMYHSVLDGSSALYERLHGRAIIFFVVGIVLMLTGVICVIINRKK